MPALLFKLRFVPEDEAQDIRDLLTENGIDYYETSAGVIGLSMPGIWLNDKSQLDRAKALIDEYQEKRHEKAREEYQNNLDAGRTRTIIDIYKEAPRRFIGYLLTIAIVIYFSFILFLNLI